MTFGTPEFTHITYNDDTVEKMKLLCRLSALPEKAPISSAKPWEMGIEFSYLQSLRTKFENEWSWKELEKKINKYENYMVRFKDGMDDLDLHFVHAKSPRKDAIPLILLHGWPGTSS